MNGLYLLILLTILTYLSHSTITVLSNSSAIKGNCSTSPFWNLNICNTTCNSCTSTDYNLCSSCQANYTLSSSDCTLNNNTYYYIYSSFLTGTQITQSDASNFYNTINYQQLSSANLISVCQGATYQFQMLGLFRREDTIGIYMSYSEQISYVSIKFNLLMLVNGVTITIYLNGESYFQKQFKKLSNLTGSYYDGKPDGGSSYLNIPSLTINSVSTIMQVIQANLAISATDLLIEVDASSAYTSNFWAISDFVLLARRCDTCPTKQLTSTISTLGTATLYTTAIVIPLLILFFCLVKWESYRKQSKLQNKIGGTQTQSHIPLKALKRVKHNLNQLNTRKQIRRSRANSQSPNIRESQILIRTTKLD